MVVLQIRSKTGMASRKSASEEIKHTDSHDFTIFLRNLTVYIFSPVFCTKNMKNEQFLDGRQDDGTGFSLPAFSQKRKQVDKGKMIFVQYKEEFAVFWMGECMIYQYTDVIEEITLEQITPDKVTMGMITLREFEQCYELLGVNETCLASCEQTYTNLRGRLDAYDDYSFGIITFLDTTDIEGDYDRIGILLKKNLFLLVDIVDTDKSTVQIFESAAHKYRAETVTVGRLVFALFEKIMQGDLAVLEDAEDAIEAMEGEVARGEADETFHNRVYKMRKDMLRLRNYYEQLITVGKDLEQDDSDLFEESDLRYFNMVTDKATRLYNNVQLLRDNLVQVREAHQAAMDLKLNQTMQLFTVVTTIFCR